MEKERGVKEGLTSQVVNESIASRKAAAVEAAWQPMTFLPPVLMLDAIPCDLHVVAAAEVDEELPTIELQGRTHQLSGSIYQSSLKGTKHYLATPRLTTTG